MAHTHDIYDDDTYFSIDPESKAIINDSTSKPVLIKGAHNSERYTFEIPRKVEGHDMTLCNRVEIHYIVVGATKQVADVYLVKDFKSDPEDENNLIFSWLISKAVTGIAGTLSFVITFKCLNGDVLDYAWPTDIYTGIKVLDTIDNGDVVEREDYKDVLETWRQSVLVELEKMLDEKVEKVRAELKETLCDKTEIFDVAALPTEDVKDTCLYRIRTFNGTFFWTYGDKLEPDGRFVLYFVDVLPAVGGVGCLYYQKSDGKYYRYASHGAWDNDIHPVVYSRAEVDAVDSHGAYLVENMDVKLYVPDTSNPYQIKWVALTNEADALITVDTLPESGGKDGYIYRIQKAYGVISSADDVESYFLPATLHYVDSLPEIGLPFDAEHIPFNIYKPKGDNGYYSYQNGEWDQIHRLFGIAQSYEELKVSNFYIGFIPESTECKLYTYDNANPFKPKWVELTGGSSGGSIITVATLPESDIDTESIYRISGDFATVYIKNADGSISTNMYNGLPAKVHIVDELPTVGEFFLDNADAPTRGVAYYCRADKDVYLYAGEWAKFSDEIGEWQEVDSIEGVTTEGIAYICLNINKGLFYYDGEWHELVDKAEVESKLAAKLDMPETTKIGVPIYNGSAKKIESVIVAAGSATASTIASRDSKGRLWVKTSSGEGTEDVAVNNRQLQLRLGYSYINFFTKSEQEYQYSPYSAAGYGWYTKSNRPITGQIYGFPINAGDYWGFRLLNGSDYEQTVDLYDCFKFGAKTEIDEVVTCCTEKAQFGHAQWIGESDADTSQILKITLAPHSSVWVQGRTIKSSSSGLETSQIGIL